MSTTMPKLAANLSLMFAESEFLDRFAAAADAGFAGVEFLFPYDFPATEIASRLKHNGLFQVLFNLPPGDWANGERGTAALPGREKEFMAGVERALEYALATGCKQIHAMAGICRLAQTGAREPRSISVISGVPPTVSQCMTLPF
jgi:hydroxypyruvate isomerase